MKISFKLEEDEIIDAIIFYLRNNKKHPVINDIDDATLNDIFEFSQGEQDGKFELEFILDDTI